MPDFTPNIIEQDDLVIFELRDEVYISAQYATEKRLRFQMWRKDILLPPDEGNIFLQSFREKLIAQAREGFNESGKPDAIPNIKEDIGTVATMLSDRSGDGKSLHDKLIEREGSSVTERLITLAEENSTLFHTPEKVAHAACKRAGRVEVYQLDTKEFRMWLRSEFRRQERERLEAAARLDRERALEAAGAMASQHIMNQPLQVGRPPAVPPYAIATAVSELEATAITDGREEEVYLRVAGHRGKIYIDLVNDKWEAVEISAKGWKVIPSTKVPIRFVRSNVMKPLPKPKRGGSIEELRRLLTLGAKEEATEEAWCLILAWLMASMRPNGGQYPVLILLGGHGTAKTTTVEILRDLLDPAVVPHEHTVKDAREVYIDCVASWVFALDNLSRLPDWLSDTICRLSTGGGFKTRTLFTNRDQEVFKAQRPVVINGISDVATRPDLLDRALLVDLPVIPQTDRKYIEELRADLEQHRPAILGVLFDALSAGLRKVQGVDLSGRLPRMADFARWAVATEGSFGFEEGTFMDAYEVSRESATETALEEAPVWHMILELSQKHQGEEKAWVGTMKDLLKEISILETDEVLKRSKHWPKTAKGLSEIVNRLRPAFLEVGVHIERESKSNKKGRRYKVFFREP